VTARDARVLHLDELPLRQVVAHGGAGTLGFHRVLERDGASPACGGAATVAPGGAPAGASDGASGATPGIPTAGAWHFVDYAVLPPGASIGVHTHGENEELYLVLDGEGVLQTGPREVRVRAGHVIVNPRGGTHGLRNDGRVPLRLFVVEVPLAEAPVADAQAGAGPR
jgi:mannose-6-phosphate isomerase-like protein (cupin superfamily)